VDKILENFKSGKQHRAPFWINMKGKYYHIAQIESIAAH
jgi:DUF438 domain-containing protein